MTLTRLFAAAALLCSLSVFAQETPARAPSDSLTPPKLDRLQIAPKMDASQLDQFRIGPNGRPFLEPPANTAVLAPEGQLGDGTTCLAIRSYVVARDNKDSDSTHLVSYSTCVPSSRYRVRKAVISPSQSER